MIWQLSRALILLAAFVFSSGGHAHATETALINGNFVLYDGAPAQALLVRDGRIAAKLAYEAS